MIRIRKKLSSRVIAFVTAAVFIICAVPSGLFEWVHAVVSPGSSAVSTDVVKFPYKTVDEIESSDITHTDKLYDNGNGTFTFKSVLSASYSFSDRSQSRAKTEDGYFELKKPGRYLVELWGGDGGTGSSLPFVNYKPGKGGDGGFVYGILNVTDDMIGKKLYYEVGSDGKSITRKIDDGGSGGIGGGAGKITLISVGAGGGYSALYLIDDGDLSNGVLKEESKDNPEKVLMIAGGGGGGGAGSNLLPIPVSGPDGGAGGTYGTLKSSTDINGFNGDFYSGKDGTSSGKKTTYVGQGGTDIPGLVNKSVLGVFEASAYPNDWLRTYHRECDRGAGGAGNLRGGGGGAGFAGGSGGLQLTAVAAENVGGGGGGSSFITSRTISVNGTDKPLIEPWQQKDGEDSVADYFTDKNTNDVGGSVIIRYIPTGKNTYAYLDSNVTVSGKISEHFDIADRKLNGDDANITIDKENNKFSFTGNIGPENEDKLTLGEPKNTLEYSLVLKPKPEFTGGNEVPIFVGDVTCQSSYADNISCQVNYDDSVKYVNVPVNYSIKTFSLMKQVDEPYDETDLYEAVESDSFTNPYIEKIDPVTIENFVADTTIGTHTYHPKMKVYPKEDSKNSVGKPNDIPVVITANAVVQVFSEMPVALDGLNVSAQKSLSYQNGAYNLSVDVNVTPDLINKKAYVIDAVPEEQKFDKPNTIDYIYKTSGSGRNELNDINQMKFFVEDVDLDAGYYYFEAMGGDGGEGATYTSLGSLIGNGGPGGKGGLIKGFIYLESSTEVKVSVGYNGADSKTLSSQSSNKGGYGGGSTTISVDDKIIVAAGGGAGGGKGHGSGKDKNETISAGDGAPGNSSTGIKTDITKYLPKGSDGGGGVGSDDEKNYLASIPAEAAPNCIDTNYVIFSGLPNYIDLPESYTVTNPENEDETFCKADNTSAGGYVKIIKLAVKGEYNYFSGDEGVKKDILTKTETDDIKNKIENYVHNINFTEEFSKYFTYFDPESLENSVEVTGINKDYYKIIETGDKLELNINLPNGQTDTENYAPFEDNPYIKTTRHDYTLSDKYNFIINVRLKPKDGFLGGNDVPLLNVDKIEDIQDFETYMQESETEMSIFHEGNTDNTEKYDDKCFIARNEVTDWANVDISLSGFEFNVNDQTVDCGSLVEADSLVETVKNPIEKAAEPWMSEFVEYTKVLTHKGDTEKFDSEKVFEDTEYTLSVNYRPKKSAADTKAKVTAPSEGKNFTLDAKVTVRYTVTYKLNNLENSRVSILPNTESGTQSDSYDVPYQTELKDTFVMSDISEDDYVVEITPAGGYRLPRAASVSGIRYDQYTSENSGGKIKISIPKENIRNNITIAASALPLPHAIHYIYETYVTGSNNGIDIAEADDTADYYKGTEIGSVIKDKLKELEGEINLSSNLPDGCDGYEWTWPDFAYDKDGELKDSVLMGDEDVYVVGKYKQTVYKLTIEYYADSKKLDDLTVKTPERAEYDDDTDSFKYPLTVDNPDYEYITPFKEGYMPDESVVKGSVIGNPDFDDGLHTEKVTYSQMNGEKGKVSIYFVEYDYNETSVKYSGKVSFDIVTESSGFWGMGKTYKYSCSIQKYIPSQFSVFKIYKDKDYSNDIAKTKKYDSSKQEISESGLNSDNAIVYSVYYKPTSPPTPPTQEELTPVKISFDPNGGIDTPTAKSELSTDDNPIGTRTFVVGKEYGFIPEINSDSSETDLSKGKYGSLPKAICKDKIFIGWFTTAEGGKQITEEDTVAEDITTLYAHWKSSVVHIKVEYKYADDVKDKSLRGQSVSGLTSQTHDETYNKSYYYDVPPLDGYEPNVTVVNGIAMEDDTIIVYYSDLTVLTLNIYSSAEDYDHAHLNSRFALKGGTFELLKGEEVIASAENENGTITWRSDDQRSDDQSINLTKGETYTLRCNSPPMGYKEYEEEITLSNFKNQKNVFLVQSFLLPFTGTANQIIYYCTGAGIMLLAALLLYKTLKKEKSYDKD